MAKRKKNQPPQLVKLPESGQIETEGQLFSLSSLDNHESFLKDISKASGTNKYILCIFLC